VRTLVELAQEVIDVVSPDKGLNVEILGGFDGSDRDESREINVRYCDTSLAAKELGYNPKITTKEGILRIAKQSNIYNDWPSI
jgi:nucleoside-diphosphate-sugar epimerase